MTYTNIVTVTLYFITDSIDEQESGLIYARYVLVFLVILWNLYTIIFPTIKFKSLEDKAMKQRYGVLYDRIWTDNVYSVLSTAAFCLRRFFLVITLLLFKEKPYALLLSISMLFTMYLLYLIIAQPHEEQFFNKIDCVNEILLIGVVYTMIIFVNADLIDYMLFWQSGYGCIGVIFLIYIINFLYMFCTFSKELYNKKKLSM